MQKALVLALLTGAFLFLQPVQAQETPLDYSCPDGGTYENHPELGHICSTPAPSGLTYLCTSTTGQFGRVKDWQQCADIIQPLSTVTTTQPLCDSQPFYRQDSEFSGAAGVTWLRQYSNGACYTVWQTNAKSVNLTDPQNLAFCPPDNSPSLLNLGGDAPNHICWVFAVHLNDCPEENGDCEPPPEECPPGTIGGCEPEPDCFLAGNGMEVCFEDPNTKCDVNTVNDEPVYSNCQAGCGFVNENFLCSTEPELPSLDDCLVTTNGYACAPDVPEPDDNITDPNKPMPDMVKGDFKDTMRGVESRIDANNLLLQDQIKRDAANTEKINKGQGQTNAYLKQIDLNTKDISESLKGDGVEFNENDKAIITGALGITGSESIEDLTVSEISLDSFKSDFQWSGGASNCPQPRAINILSKTFYMEWEPFCESFQILSYFLLAAASLASGFIAFGVKR